MIIGFVTDLIFAARIESAAEILGYRVRWIERHEQIAPPAGEGESRQAGERLSGPGAALIELVTSLHPVLIIFDLGNSHIPWRQWIALLKTASATRRYPLICYGSHIAADTLRAAEQAGADAVLPRSRFISDLPEVITEYARQVDYAALQATCRLPLSSLALHGLELFNRGEYFEAHEALEEAWNADDTPGRELYRAILQVAVAYLQIERDNYNGALKMFLRLRQWIDPLPDVCRGVEVARLRSDARRAYEALLDLGRERLSEFDRSLFQPVHFIIPT